MVTMNPLHPLAEVLLAARQPDGSWAEPLAWLAGQVLEKCECSCHWNAAVGHYWLKNPQEPCVCAGGWRVRDPTDWPIGWAYGLGRVWVGILWVGIPQAHCWCDRLSDALLYGLIDRLEGGASPTEVDSTAVALLVEAVQAINNPGHPKCP